MREPRPEALLAQPAMAEQQPRDEALGRLGGDRDLLRELAATFLDQAPRWMDAVFNGHIEPPSGVKRSIPKALSDLAETVKVEEISRGHYLRVLAEARSRGIVGGLIYDALHAETARRLGAEKVFTYNTSNFKHVAPDLVIAEPQ